MNIQAPTEDRRARHAPNPARSPNSPSPAIHRPVPARATEPPARSASLVLFPPLLSAEFPSVPPGSSFLSLVLPFRLSLLRYLPTHTPPILIPGQCPAICPLPSHARLRARLPSSPCLKGSGQSRTRAGDLRRGPTCLSGTQRTVREPGDFAPGPSGGQGGGLGRQCRTTGRWRQRRREIKARLALPGWGEEAANEAERRPLPARRIQSQRRRRCALDPAQPPQPSSALARSLRLARASTRQEKPFVS